MEQIRKIIREYPGYGCRGVIHELKSRSMIVNHKRILRLISEAKLTFRKSRFRLITTDSEHGNPVYPNLIRRMEINRPNQVCGADFTFVRLRNGYTYWVIEKILHISRVMGWLLSRDLDPDNAFIAL